MSIIRFGMKNGGLASKLGKGLFGKKAENAPLVNPNAGKDIVKAFQASATAKENAPKPLLKF